MDKQEKVRYLHNSLAIVELLSSGGFLVLRGSWAKSLFASSLHPALSSLD
jgi:hypothetical protein